MASKKKVDYKQLNSNKRFCNEDVITAVALKMNISTDLVREVLEIQSNFTSTRMRAGGLEKIILPYLGSFQVNHKKVQKMMANQLKR